MSKTDDQLYLQAMAVVDRLVEDVLKTCGEVADENHFEKEWVLDRFREQFNKAKRKG